MDKKVGVMVAVTSETLKMFFDDENGHKVLSEAVGGFFEAVRLSPSLTMWVNENGKLSGLDVNRIGTVWFESAFGQYSDDVIVGNVFFTGGVDESGNTLGLTHDQVASIEYAASAVRSGGW